jgi:hypothetical protein
MSSLRPRRVVLLTLTGVCAALVLVPSLAPATIEEQRARLPPPATCQDPVEGVWMSHKYEPPYDEWMIFTLQIHRDPRGAQAPTVLGVPGRIPLAGYIQAHAWFGSGPQASAPPPCTSGQSHWEVAMTAEGHVTGMRVEFWGTSWNISAVHCGSRYFRYNLDHFTGVIDPAIQEFQSVNNDGGRAINDPTVFRRVRCFDPSSPPHPYVAPPSFQPPGRSGCSRSWTR